MALFRNKALLLAGILLIAGLIFTGCAGGKQTATEGKSQAIRMGTNVEFLEREDGLPALEKAYGFEFNREALVTMKTGLTYEALKNEKIDVAMGFATDGRIAAFDLVNLVDDKKFFPVYNPAPTIRSEVLEAYPGLAEDINKLPPLLDNDTLIELNKRIDVDGMEPREVAAEFLREKGLLEKDSKKEGPTITVSSKEFSEQLLLGQLLLQYLEAKGYPVEDQTGLGGTPILRRALQAGEIDVYWEYTGTVLMTVMKEQSITQQQEAYNKVRKWDKEENAIIWLDYAPANNTYTLMMKRQRAEKLGIKTISDLANHINGSN